MSKIPLEWKFLEVWVFPLFTIPGSCSLQFSHSAAAVKPSVMLDSSPVPGILQARTLEWVAISFTSAWKWKVKVKSLSRVRPLATT